MTSKRSNSMFDSNTLNLHQQQSTGHLISNFTNTLGYTLSNTLNTKGHSSKLIHIAVVGLSGTEKDKGCVGVGKSCICNRFVSPNTDDYNYEHISVLSQTDFSGRVVNNDHFLWFGQVCKFNDYYYENNYFNNNATLINNSSNYVNFSIIEQTTFIDDTSFQPFNSGKLEPYVKRIQNLKLHSPEKLQYICKNQLGIEREYPQRYLHDGKFVVDGFICCFDVSIIQGRTLDSAIEQTALILNCLMKTKKPILVATTKNDEANEFYVREIQLLLQRKEFRSYNIPLIETSAHENINVDQAFFALAQMIDKKIKHVKPALSYMEALRLRKDHMELVHQAYQSLITKRFFDPNLTWPECSNYICSQPEYFQFCDLFGHDNAIKLFDKHIKNLKNQLINQKLQVYLKVLPQILNLMLDENFEDEILTSNQLNGTLSNSDLDLSTLWNLTKLRLIEHPEFNNYFTINPNLSWRDANIIQKNNDLNEIMIPFDLLETEEAENCFNEFRNQLKMNYKHIEMKLQFKQLLEETGYVTPGKPFNEIRVLFMGRECYENLSEQSIIEIYEEHQQSITERAKYNFQELLLENPDLFFHYASLNEVITQEDLIKINQQLKDDIRFKALDNLEQERTLILLKHLGFIHNPLKEHCHSFPNCIDVLNEQTMALVSRKFSLSHVNQIFVEDKYNELNLILIGMDQLAEELASLLKNININFKKDNFRFTLDFRLINGNFDIKEQNTLLSACSSNSINHGCFCIYSSALSLDYISNCLERTFLSNLSENDLLFNGLPIIFLFSPDFDLTDTEIEFLKEEGQNKAKRFQAIFLDVSNLQKHLELKYEEQLLKEALIAMIDQIERRAEFLSLINQSTLSQQELHQFNQKLVKQLNKKDCPDIRILLCLFCGDIYSVEQVITPFLDHCLKTKNKIKVTSTSSFMIKIKVNNSIKKVEFLLTSYHNSTNYRDELLHGFFLVFSTIRKASLAALISFSKNIPNTPTVIYGQIIDSNLLLLADQHMIYNENLSNQLIEQSNLFAKKINAHFVLSNMFYDAKGNLDYNLDLFQDFFEEVLQRKPQIEKAFEIDDDYLKQQDQNRNFSSNKQEQQRQMRPTKPQIKSTKKLPPLPRRGESLNLNKLDYQKHSVESLQKELDDEDEEEEEDLNQDLSDEKLRVTEDEDDRTYEQLPIINEVINTKNLVKQRKQKYELSGTPSPIITTPSDDSEIYATIFNQNNENLLKPSQIKSRRHLQTDMLHKTYQSCESLDYSNYNLQQKNKYSPQIPQSTSQHQQKAHSPNLQTQQSYNFSPSPNYQQQTSSGKINMCQRKLPKQPIASKSIKQQQQYDQQSSPYSYSQSSSCSISNLDKSFHDQSYSKYSPSQSSSIKSPDTTDNSNLVLQTFRNENQLKQQLRQPRQQQQQSIYGTASRKYFTTERSHSMLDASHFQLKKQNFLQQQQSIANELKQKQKLKQQADKELLLPVCQVKEKVKSRDLLSDELLSEEDTPSSDISEQLEPAPTGSFERQYQAQDKNKNKPGKLNLKEFDNITNAVGRLNLSSLNLNKNVLPKITTDVEKSDYVPKDQPYGYPKQVESYSYKEQFSKKLNQDVIQSDSESDDSSSEKSKPSKRKFLSRKKINIQPVAPPTIPDKFLMEKEMADKMMQEIIFNEYAAQQEKLNATKLEQENKKISAAAEKKKAKEELKLSKAKKKKSKQTKGDKRNSLIFVQSDNQVPLFMEKCIQFIEENGLDLEGLYRVPGNKCNVTDLFEKFIEDQNFSIKEADIQVSTVATALKEFVSKKLPHLIPDSLLDELKNLIIQENVDRMDKLTEFKCLLNKLPILNYNILKYLFQHFSKVAENSRYNSMDTKNIAICWWPTLFNFNFTDLLMFEQIRTHCEDFMQSLIEENEYVFSEN